VPLTTIQTRRQRQRSNELVEDEKIGLPVPVVTGGIAVDTESKHFDNINQHDHK